MTVQNEVLEFLLDTAIRHGDNPTAAKASALKEKLHQEQEPMASVLAAIPHVGAQSPQPKTKEGLGGTNEAAANQTKSVRTDK